MSKEQIEEMVAVVRNNTESCKTCTWYKDGLCMEDCELEEDNQKICTDLYNAGYRKQPTADVYDRPKHWEEEIYQWGKGDDAVGDEVLCALNNIIRGLYTIEGIDGGFSGLLDRLNVSTDYHKMVMEFDADIDLCDLAFRFEVVRTMLFGSKINYDFLGDHLHKVAQERYKASEAYHFEAEYKNRRNGQ